MYKCCVFFQVNLGPDKMVVDLTDPNRPRFTLQELRDVLQERNKFKSQLLLVQEELQCYRRWVPLRGRGAPRRPAWRSLGLLDMLRVCSGVRPLRGSVLGAGPQR